MTYPIPHRLVIATSNRGKQAEFQEMFTNINCEIIAQDAFGVKNVEETGLTFIENAILKARAAAKVSGLPALADDSGIEVDALSGNPGIYSARFAGENATDQDNLNKLLHDLKGVPDLKRTARYQCVIVLMKSEKDPSPLIFNGSWEGCILEVPKGNGGFGYDPIFLPLKTQLTAAEMDSTHKNKISHRGAAIRKLRQFFNI